MLLERIVFVPKVCAWRTLSSVRSLDWGISRFNPRFNLSEPEAESSDSKCRGKKFPPHLNVTTYIRCQVRYCFQAQNLSDKFSFRQVTPDHHKETQTAVVRSCLPFIRSGQNHLARHSERGKKTRQTEEEMGRQDQGMDRPGVRQVPEGSGEQGKWRKLVAKSSVASQRPSRLKD